MCSRKCCTILRRNVAPGNSQVDQTATAQKGSRLLAGVFHSFFSWSSPNFNENRWESFPTPSRRLKKERAYREVFTVVSPPPILWLGIKPFKKKPAKDQRLNITKHRPKTNHFAVSHVVRWSESQGVWWQFRWKMQVFSFVFGLDDWICVFFCCGKKANQFFLQIVPGMSWKISE